jgi:hypothetical protein
VAKRERGPEFDVQRTSMLLGDSGTLDGMDIVRARCTLISFSNPAQLTSLFLAPHCPLGPISLAASIQIAVTSPNFVIQEMSLGIHYNKMTPPEAGNYDLCSYLKNPEVFAVKDGYVQTPKGVGLGIEIDEEAVRKVAVDCKAWRCLEFFGPGGEVREW